MIPKTNNAVQMIDYFSEEEKALARTVDFLRKAADACAAAAPKPKDAIHALAHDLAARVVKAGR